MTLASDLKDRVKQLCARADVHVEHKRVGRGVTKAWLLDYARDEHRLPPEIVDFYAELDGLTLSWRGNGLPGGPRELARGLFVLRKLDDLMWFSHGAIEVMRLESDYCSQGLLLVRRGDDIRAVYSPSLLSGDDLSAAVDLGTFSEMITAAMDRAFLPPELIGSPIVDAVRDALTRRPAKRKVVAGARVFGAKIKTASFGLDRRGTVRELVKATNGKTYALVDWDLGDRSYTRSALLAVVADDTYERVRSRSLDEAAPADLDGLLDQFSNNCGVALYRDADPDAAVRITCEATLWLASASAMTPLRDYIAWAEARLAALRSAHPDGDGGITSGSVVMPLTGSFNGSYVHLFTSAVDPLRRARVIAECAALRWARAPEGVARSVILDLLKQLPWERDEDEETLVSAIRADAPVADLAAVPESADDSQRAAAVGLEGAPIYYTHD